MSVAELDEIMLEAAPDRAAKPQRRRQFDADERRAVSRWLADGGNPRRWQADGPLAPLSNSMREIINSSYLVLDARRKK